MNATILKAQSMTPMLTTNDLERSIRFYTEGLGFEVTDKYEHDGKLGGVMLKAGNAEIALSRDDFAKGKDRVKGAGMRLYTGRVLPSNRLDGS